MRYAETRRSLRATYEDAWRSAIARLKRRQIETYWRSCPKPLAPTRCGGNRGMAMASKPETQIARVRRYCAKVIARSDKVRDQYGDAYWMISGWKERKSTAIVVLKELDR